ncbi:hypothetical protein DID98_00445 [Burkholderia sp. Bp8984]|nr:hypothetical protein DID98_00445 [Burkholderia sp. Bp8984]
MLDDDRRASAVGDEFRGMPSILVTHRPSAIDVHGVRHDEDLPCIACCHLDSAMPIVARFAGPD